MPNIAKGAARAFTEAQLGGPIVETDSNPTAQTAATILIQSNGDRVGLVVINLGINDVYLALNSGVSNTNGIKLNKQGGNVAMNVRDDFTLPSRAWYAIGDGGTSQVYVLELLRDILSQTDAQS